MVRWWLVYWVLVPACLLYPGPGPALTLAAILLAWHRSSRPAGPQQQQSGSYLSL